MTRWFAAVGTLVVVAAVTWRDLLSGSVTTLFVIAAGIAFAWWVSPLHGRGGPRHADVVADPGGHPVTVYWRPGCIYCVRLRGALGRDQKKVTWVSIWADEDAAAYVRSVNDGNETVPTVRIGEQVHTNPDPELVRAVLR